MCAISWKAWRAEPPFQRCRAMILAEGMQSGGDFVIMLHRREKDHVRGLDC